MRTSQPLAGRSRCFLLFRRSSVAQQSGEGDALLLSFGNQHSEDKQVEKSDYWSGSEPSRMFPQAR